MRIAIIADPHFRGLDFYSQQAGWRKILTTSKAKGVSWVVVAGDFFDRPTIGDKVLPTETLIRGTALPVEEVGLPTLVIEGNHDWTGDIRHTRAISVFTEHRKILPVMIPRVLRLADGDTHPVSLLLFPWPWLSGKDGGSAPEQWKAYVSRFKNVDTKQDRRIFIGHVQVDGTVANNGFTLPGATMGFSEAELEDTRSDAIFLGHIHNRQGYYVGAPWQLDHGEKGNVCGWEIYDSETNSSEFLTLDEGPRYFTVTRAEYEAEGFTKNVSDHVRVLCDRAPKVMRAGDVFVKTQEAKNYKRQRCDVDDITDVWALVRSWAAKVGVDAEELLPHVRQDLAIQSSICVGDLLSIDRIIMRNIGPHKNLDWSPSEYDWYAIAGPSGKGKSYLLEAPLATLFGEFPHRGHIGSSARGEDAELCLHLSTKEGKWVWRRLLKKGKWSAEVVFDPDGKKDKLTTGLDKATAIAEEKIGSKRTLLWSSFISQSGFKDKDGKRDILLADPSKRMDFLRTFLGLEVFDELCKSFEAPYKKAVEALTKGRAVEHKLEEYKQAKANLEENLIPVLGQLEEIRARIKTSEAETHITNDKVLSQLRQAQNHYTEVQRDSIRIKSELNVAKQKVDSEFRSLKSDFQRSAEAEKSLNNIPCKGMGINGGCLDCHLIKNTEAQAKEKEDIYKRLVSIKDRVESGEEFSVKAAAVQEAEIALETAVQEVKRLQTEVASATPRTVTETKELRERELTLVQYEGTINGKLEIVNGNISKMVGMVEKIPDLEREERVYKNLLAAFGRKGVSQILIDQHLVEIQDIVDNICEEDFGGVFEIELTTVKTNKEDTQEETFTVLFRRDGVEIPFEFASGGELSLIRSILRVAMILYQARRTDGGLRVAFLDEPDAHQDESQIQGTVKMLERLRPLFNQVFLVSHDVGLLSMFPNKFVLPQGG